MKRRKILLAGLVAVALVTGLFWLIFRSQEPPEPVYQGKRLSEWLSQRIYILDAPNDPGVLNEEATQAVRQIGTNAIPTLLQMLRAHDSNLKLKLVALAQRQRLIKINFVPAEQRNRDAELGFFVLRSDASNAVPALIQIYEEDISEDSQKHTAYALAYIGPPAAPAVPLLLRTADNTNASGVVRGSAAFALGRLHVQTELVVPVLIKCLRDSNLDVRYDALLALTFLKSDAKAAVPALIDLLQDPDTAVRGTAETVLMTIDPEAAAKAGVK